MLDRRGISDRIRDSRNIPRDGRRTKKVTSTVETELVAKRGVKGTKEEKEQGKNLQKDRIKSTDKKLYPSFTACMRQSEALIMSETPFLY